MEQMPIMLMSTAFPKEMWAHPDLVLARHRSSR